MIPDHAAAALAEVETAWDVADGLANGKLSSGWAVEQAAVPENPDGVQTDGDGFRVAVPCSGGLDSATVAAMAHDTGLPMRLYYVDAGQRYMKYELRAVRDLFGVTPVILTAPVASKQHAHVMPGRNAAILFLIAADMRERGEWGEVWFGNLAGESPVVGGDKSSRFFLTAQHLMTELGLDVRAVNVLAGLDKPDLVRWWRARGQLDQARRTRTCFTADAGHCGACQACFRRLVGFEAAGVDTRTWWTNGEEWDQHAAKYLTVMRAALASNDYTRYSPARCRSTLDVIELLARQRRI